MTTTPQHRWSLFQLVTAGNDGTPVSAEPILHTFIRIKAGLLTLSLVVNNIYSRRAVGCNKSPVDVSLTTYGPRTRGAFVTIESIAAGVVRPRRLILWVDEPEILANPPRTLRRLMKRGLEIRVCEKMGPHAKYFPYARQFAHDRMLLVTADDDVLYPRWWLQRLLKAYNAQPGYVTAYRAWRVARSADGRPESYARWSLCQSATASLDHFATGVSGVLYDHKMVDLLRRYGSGFMEVCPRADDVWLYYVAISSGIQIRQVEEGALEFWRRLRTIADGLAFSNTTGGGNDHAIAATARFFEEDSGN